MDWQPVFSGKIWQVMQGLHKSGKTFEKAVRSPGSRIIIIDKGMVLLSREKRRELGDKIDYRLPGGKVFDSNEEYAAFLLSDGDIIEESRKSISKEAIEEVGIVVAPENLKYLGTDVLGATCEWDLIYWTSEQFSENEKGAEHHESEADEIMGTVWVGFDEAKNLALDPDSFSESRSARMLLSYLDAR